MTTIEQIEIDGEVREVEVDWRLFDTSNKKTKNTFIKTIAYLDMVNAKNIGKFTSSKAKMSFNIGDLYYSQTPSNIPATVRGIIKFKETCKIAGDEFIKLANRNNKGTAQALVRLKYGTELLMNYTSYIPYINGRKKFIEQLEEVGGVVLSDYISSSDEITFKIGEVLIKTTPDTFKNSIFKRIKKYFDALNENTQHRFIKWVDYDSAGLRALMETTHNGVSEQFELHIGTYNYTTSGFLRAEKSIYDYAKQNNYKILTPYTNANCKLLIDFNCGHKPSLIRASHFSSGVGCKKCSIINKTGENSYLWKGGITPLHEYLRHKITSWKIDSMKKYNKTCAITGRKSSNNIVHHIIGFSDILFETMDAVGLDIRENVSLYTEEELKSIEDKCLELHYKYGLGVVLCEEVHKEFHSIYGYGNNTPEQFEEFKNNKLRKIKEVV